MEDAILTIHILAAATWIGGSASVMFLHGRMRQVGHGEGSAFMAGFEKMGRMYFPPAAIVLLLTGIWLVTNDGAFEFSDGFVVIGVAVVVIGALLGSLVFSPIAKQAKQAHGDRDEASVERAYRRFQGFGILDLALLVFAVIAMVTKLGH